MRFSFSVLLAIILCYSAAAFRKACSFGRSRGLSLGVKNSLPPNPSKGNANQKAETSEPSKPKMTVSNIVQLVLMGAGAPGLGEYKGTDENGKMMFELEANNLVDNKGNVRQTQAKYFEDGYVGEDFAEKPPGFFSNLLSGGKLQREWDERNSNRK